MNQTIRTLLIEALGVPEGIIDASENLYNKILYKVKSLSSIDEEFEIEMNVNMKISDFKIKKIIVIVDFVETDQVDEVRYYNMAFHHKSKYDDPTKKIVSKPYDGIVKLSIGIAHPEDSNVSDVIEYFKSHKNNITTSLSHELKHAYDDYKKPTTGVGNISRYLGVQSTNFPFKPISNFLFTLYFIHSIENLVRPSEFATLMRLNKISKKDFYKFVSSSEMYRNLKNANNFTYEGLKEELKNETPKIKNFFKQQGWDIPNSEDELIDELLRILYVNISNNTTEKIKSLMADNMFEQFLGFMGDKNDFFVKLAKFASRFDGREKDFYRYEEKNLKYISDKMLRKIFKLYAMANDDKNSIKDWELHQKISGKTNETIDKDYKYNFK